jgi:hypothetical protein
LANIAGAGQDRLVTDPRSPLDAALDLLIYLPVGLALTAAEEIPKLAAKGRAQVDSQLAVAKVVGQFTVAQGRKELTKRFAPPATPRGPRPARQGEAQPARENDGSPPAPGSGGPGADAVGTEEESAGAAGHHDLEDDLGATGAGVSGEDVAGDAVGSGEDVARDAVGSGEDVAASVIVAPSPAGLAIPGYDSLAASQVVQRLDGLSAEELAAVDTYERTHRARRTILTRVRQLQEP